MVEEVEDPEVQAARLKPQLPTDHGSVLLSSDDEDDEPEVQSAPSKQKTDKRATAPAPSVNEPTPAARPKTIYINYPDREYFSYVRTKLKPRESNNLPPIAPHDIITPHSSRGVRRDKYGCEDPLGVNGQMEKEIIEYVRAMTEKDGGDAPALTDTDIPQLREQWQAEVTDLTGEIPLELPPWREVNHRIPLVNDTKQYNYHHPKCPDALKDELRIKMDRYLRAGWWEMRPASQAAPLLCVCKKNGKLRTVVDARQRNNNTIKDVMPFPDQDNIRQDVA